MLFSVFKALFKSQEIKKFHISPPAYLVINLSEVYAEGIFHGLNLQFITQQSQKYCTLPVVLMHIVLLQLLCHEIAALCYFHPSIAHCPRVYRKSIRHNCANSQSECLYSYVWQFVRGSLFLLYISLNSKKEIQKETKRRDLQELQHTEITISGQKDLLVLWDE